MALNREEATRRQLGGMGRTKLWEITKTGELRSVKIGRSRLYSDEAIADYIAALESKQELVQQPRSEAA